MRKRLHQILEHKDPSDRTGRWINTLLMTIIVVSVIVAMLDTVPAIRAEYAEALNAMEWFIVIVFCLEYCTRLWSCVEERKYTHPLWGRLRYMLIPLMLVDLLSILPAFLTFLSGDLVVLRSIRLLRMMRILKLGRYSKGFGLVADVLHDKREELLAALSILLFLLFLSSNLMFVVEREAQPEAFGSILDALWWGVSTITSVGYGDIMPVTPAGKLIGGIVQMLGVGLFAIPAGVFAAGFTEEVSRKKEQSRRAAEHKRCPHCGEEI